MTGGSSVVVLRNVFLGHSVYGQETRISLPKEAHYAASQMHCERAEGGG